MIVPMKKLTLAALLEHREAILQALQSICAVQLISIGEGEQSSAAAEGRVQRLQSAEELLKPYAGKAGFGPRLRGRSLRRIYSRHWRSVPSWRGCKGA